MAYLLDIVALPDKQILLKKIPIVFLNFISYFSNICYPGFLVFLAISVDVWVWKFLSLQCSIFWQGEFRSNADLHTIKFTMLKEGRDSFVYEYKPKLKCWNKKILQFLNMIIDFYNNKKKSPSASP